jgi:hypothetical protein
MRCKIRELRICLLVAAIVLAGVNGPRLDAAAAPGQETGGSGAARSRQLLDTYCTTCHNDRIRSGGLLLDTADVTSAGAQPEVWEKVITRLRAGSMPPSGRPRPDQAAADAMASWLSAEIDRTAAAHPNPGRTEAFHRLNRAEYQNAVRDLLALDIDVATLLPTDDADKRGFDNIGDVLSVSPALMDRYLSAAKKLSRLAVGVEPAGAVIDTHRIPRLMAQDERVSQDLPFGSRGGMAIRHQFPVDGEYSVKIRLQRNYVDYLRGIGEPHDITVRLDGVRIKQFRVGGEAPGRPVPASFAGNIVGDPAWEQYMLHADDGLEARFAAKAGSRVLGVSFPREQKEPEGILQPRQTGFSLAINEMYDGNPAVESVEVAGPFNVSGPGDSASRQRILICRPSVKADEEGCARNILATLARRAYRRPLQPKDVQTLMHFYEEGRRDGKFDDGIQFALERLLIDPDFLFRVESDPAAIKPSTAYRLSDIELASRLSFFLWSSIPDDDLLDMAVKGKLSNPAILEQQVRRMLADRRSSALVDNFTGQWLRLRELKELTPDPAAYPDFDDNLRLALQQETELFVDSQIREDRSVVDLLTANYSFINERLARHYGIPNVYGERFRRVTLTGDQRGGLLGQGSVLAVTSYPTRTSPVLRGKFLLETILGTPPPPPPPNVPGLPDRGEGGKPASVRERLEQHRKNPVCASCHSQMDPLGFALEHFDGIGAWRTMTESHLPVDSSGSLPNGAQLEGLPGLRAFLSRRREQFAGTITGKLLAYALGRAVQPYDQPIIRAILRQTEPTGYKWSGLILGIVKSTPFQMRLSRPAGSETAAAGSNTRSLAERGVDGP